MAPDEPVFLPILRVLWRSRILIASVSFLFVVSFGAYAFLASKIYKSEAVLSAVHEDDKGGALSQMLDKVGGLAALAGAFQPGKQSDEAIFMLRSRSLGEEFIRNEGLMQIIYADQWDARAKAWKQAGSARVPTVQDAYRVFDSKIRDVSVDQKSGLVTLTIRWKDPVLAQRWASKLIASVNQRMRKADITEATENLEFLDKELKQTSIVDIQQAIYRLVEAQTRRKMLANVREEYSFRVIDPPIVPDKDKYESPKKILLVLLGGMLGLMFGCLIVATLRARDAIRA
jgi:uncharacterized protein involved in exopolysaccharide biosynthesis